MSPPARPDFDQLAQALARLLATWWHLHATTAMQSRAPPKMPTDQSESQFPFPADESLKIREEMRKQP
jgi:hypothetical protein